MTRFNRGLTILESLVVILVCVVLLWVVVPVGMVRLGWKEAGEMVVTDDDKRLESSGTTLTPEAMRPRVEGIEKPRVLQENQVIPPVPNTPKKNPLDQ